uniref:Uncharacterized protein n=1 Tax=Setaria digitata TaxID=48799 RepID=A0A915Q1A6_9BILA
MGFFVSFITVIWHSLRQMASWIRHHFQLFLCRTNLHSVALRSSDNDHQNSPFLSDPSEDRLDLEQNIEGTTALLPNRANYLPSCLYCNVKIGLEVNVVVFSLRQLKVSFYQ